MSKEQVSRKLVAVLHADVKDYSRLMSEDEIATVRTLTAYRQVMSGLVQRHSGRIVDTAGDGFLIEFASVVDAVECAVGFQQELRPLNAQLPANRKMEFRIGINVGDVIQQDDKIFGEGVNIAARLEGLAEPGGICISGTAYDQVKKKLNLRYEDLGEQSVKNIPGPVRVYRILIAPSISMPKQNAKADRGKGPSPNASQSPTIWNVPHQRNPRFTGRKALLAEVKKTLRRKGKALKIAVLYGLGGVGKTQIALHYLHDRQEDYSLVWWLRAENSTTLGLDFTALAPKLGLSTDAAPQDVTRAIRRWLERHEGWLLVFDNAVEPKDLKEYLPEGNGGVIITSRNHTWRSLAEPMKVQEWLPDEAADFLVKRSGDKDLEAALNLAKELGCLPLALEQAGAYIEACVSSCAKYMELFREHHQELLKKGKPLDYRDTVATTWKLSFESLRKESPAAADLMDLCAFFAPEAIPFDLFTEHLEYLPTSLKEAAKEPLKWNEVMAGLKRYSLAEVAPDSLSFHRLVQMVARNRMKPAERKRKVAAAVRVVNAAYGFKRDDLETWPRARQLLPHGMAAAEHWHEAQVDDRAGARLLNEMGLHLKMLGHFSDAKELLGRALSIAEKVYGLDHPEVATVWNNLGMVLKDLGDLDGAKANYERALKIAEKVYGPDHPTVATVWNNVGMVLKDLGDLGGAKANYERALRIGEKVYGPDHPEVAISLNNLGSVLQDLGDLEGAKVNCERALAILRAWLGDDHPKTKLVLKNLKSLESNE